jgi:hypothetical protein
MVTTTTTITSITTMGLTVRPYLVPAAAQTCSSSNSSCRVTAATQQQQ